MRFRAILCSLDMIPAVTAEVVVDAEDVDDAKDKALAMRDDDLEWFTDIGRPFDGEVFGDIAVADGIEPATDEEDR